jgi:hypothetical protein
MPEIRSNYGMELDMEVESTIANLHRSNEGFSFEQQGLINGTYRCFTGGYYVDGEGRRLELMSRWRQSKQLSQIILSSLLRQPKPEPYPLYDTVSLTIDDPFRRIGRICFWDSMSPSKCRSLMESIMVMIEINEDEYDLSEISNPNPFDRHDYHEAILWTPGNKGLSEYQPDDACALEQSLIQVVQHGSEIGWQTIWR